MKPKGKGPARSATDEITGSEDEFDEPVIGVLGKRNRFGILGKRAEEKKDLSGEEAERPPKNRVSRVTLLVHSDRLDF